MDVTLQLKVWDGKLYRDTDVGSKMDPFVKLEVGNQKFETKVHEKAGKYPKWEQSFTIKTKLNALLKFSVMDKDFMGADLVGEGAIDLVRNYALLQKTVEVPIIYEGKMSGEIRMDLLLEVEEKFHKQLKAELEADLNEKKALVEAVNRGEKKELPKPLVIKPAPPKKEGALDEAEEKELKDDLANLKNEETEVDKKMKVRENDKAEMVRRMLSGTLIQTQLKNHIDDVKKQIEDYKRIDIKGTVTIKILRARLTTGCQDPVVFVTLGKKSTRTKPQDEESKNPVWNETLELERTQSDESVLIFWILDEGFKDFIVGYTALSVYPAIFSKLNEKYHLPLFLGNNNVGELIFHVCFKRKA